jgi:cardiolipin synthase (CMP-forming)
MLECHAQHPTLSDVSPEEPTTDGHVPPSSMFDGMWTVPNLITLARLLCLPIFLYLLFGAENRAAAAWMLGALGATDWVDGYLARRLGQVSEFGKVFDPTVDRLLFIVAVTAIIVDGSIPVWFAVTVLVRELLVGAMMAIATLVYKMPRIDVTYWGKLATFLLMFAVPGFLMGNSDMPGAAGFEVAAWILGIPGLALSIWTAIVYVPQVKRAVASGPAHHSGQVTPTG